MGAWGPNVFENDVAADWADGLSKARTLALVRGALKKATKSKKGLDADAASEALAACEVIARLRGHFGPRTTSNEAVDAWVRTHPSAVPRDLLKLARHAIDRVFGDGSELRQLWEDAGAMPWLKAVRSLRARLHAPKKAVRSTRAEVERAAQRAARRQAVRKPIDPAAGEWYAVPLRGGGYGAVLVLRVERRKSRERMGIFGGLPRRYAKQPTLHDLNDTTILDIRCLIYSDMPLVKDRWKRIGTQLGFSHESWPLIPEPSGSRYFASRDNDALDYAAFRRHLIKPGDHRYFAQRIPEYGGGCPMSTVIPEIVRKGNSSVHYYQVTAAHLRVYEKIKPILQKHARLR